MNLDKNTSITNKMYFFHAYIIDRKCAIEREQHITPNFDDIINQLNGSSVFSKLDLTAGYHQCILDEQSFYITTFTTHTLINYVCVAINV